MILTLTIYNDSEEPEDSTALLEVVLDEFDSGREDGIRVFHTKRRGHHVFVEVDETREVHRVSSM